MHEQSFGDRHPIIAWIIIGAYVIYGVVVGIGLIVLGPGGLQ